MKPLIYLRFLRPLRSLVVIALCTCIADGWRNLLHVDSSTASLLAVVVALPLLLGVCIAGAAHEPMHRPFALLLPNILRRQRMAATVSSLVAALSVTCVASWSIPTVSPVATFGLASALITLPCLDRRQFLRGQAGVLIAFFGWLMFGVTVGDKLAMAMNTAPWLFLLGGMAITAVSLVRAFSHESLRARAGTLFIAFQTHTFSYLFHRGMVVRWQAELLAQKTRKEKVPSLTGADWKVHSVGASSLDWMQVFWHANFGANKKSFIRVQLGLATTLLINAAILSGIAFIFGQKEYCATLAQMADPNTKMGGGIGPVAAMLQPSMAALCVLTVFAPKLAYPISRARLATTVFLQIGAQWAIALVIPAATIFFVSFIGQILSGKFLPGYGLPALLSVDLLLGALLPLLVAAGTVRGSTLRIITTVPIVGAIMVVAVSSSHWRQYVLTWSGLCVLFLATAASQWLLWYRLHRDYAISDLPFEVGMSTGVFGMPTPR